MIMKEKYAKMWDQLDRAPASCRQLEEYMRIAPEENGPVWDKKDDGNKKTSYRWRWKFIGRGENGVPAALKSWNGKPALITQVEMNTERVDLTAVLTGWQATQGRRIC